MMQLTLRTCVGKDLCEQKSPVQAFDGVRRLLRMYELERLLNHGRGQL